MKNELRELVRRRIEKIVNAMLKVIHVMDLREATNVLYGDLAGIMTYREMPRVRWCGIRANNEIGRVRYEIRRRPYVVSTFLDGKPALMLAAVCLKTS